MTSNSTPPTLTIGFATVNGESEHTYAVRLESSAVGQASGQLTLPHDPLTWRAVQLALEPDFANRTASPELAQRLAPLGDLTQLKQTVGDLLAAALLGGALCGGPDVVTLFDRALAMDRATHAALHLHLTACEAQFTHGLVEYLS